MKLINIFLLLLCTCISLPTSAFNLHDQYQVFDGKPLNLSDKIGKQPIYLKFWATWCLECREELPSLQRAYEEFGKSITMYAVNLNINESEKYIRHFQAINDLTIPMVMDKNGSIAGNFQFYGTPFHVLINADGEVVYTTYKDDTELRTQLIALANNTHLKSIEKETTKPEKIKISPLPNGLSLIYFSATWCDWYMKDIHPDMANNCIEANRIVNGLHKHNPQLNIQAYVTSLWTEEKDLESYRKKHAIQYKIEVDNANHIARNYMASEYPTLLVFKDGKEVKRITQFSNNQALSQELNSILNNI